MLLKTPGMQDTDNVLCDTTSNEKAENDTTNRLIRQASCKAPIASLDCMEEFASTTAADFSNSAAYREHGTAAAAAMSISRQTSLCNATSASPVYSTQRIHYKNLGKSGIRVSNIGLATWITFGTQVSDEVAEDIVTLAYESGINIFDTAEAFTAGRAEVLLGKILKKKEWRRSSYLVTTKLYWSGKAETERGLSRKHIIEGVQSSLDRLQLNYVDVVFANKADSLCPMEEIVRAFTYCINQNMVMYWGTSRWTPAEIMEAYGVARQFNLIPPICEQMEYHMFCREKGEIQLPEMYHKIGVGAITWSPLVCGVLDSRFDDGNQTVPPPPFSRANTHKGYTWLKDKLQSEGARKQQSKIEEVTQIAEKLGCTFSQLTIAWCLRNEIVHCVLVGATSVDQIHDHLLALQIRPKLSSVVMSQLDAILDNKPVRKPPKR